MARDDSLPNQVSKQEGGNPAAVPQPSRAAEALEAEEGYSYEDTGLCLMLAEIVYKEKETRGSKQHKVE